MTAAEARARLERAVGDRDAPLAVVDLDALLSTASGRDSAYIAVHQFVGVDDTAYFRHVEDLMLGLDGRPHWGKKHAAGADVLAPRYAGWDRFQAVRDRLDPTGVFTSAHLTQTLGAPAALRGRS